jgi:hypothetical protein
MSAGWALPDAADGRRLWAGTAVKPCGLAARAAPWRVTAARLGVVEAGVAWDEGLAGDPVARRDEGAPVPLPGRAARSVAKIPVLGWVVLFAFGCDLLTWWAPSW